LLTPKLETIRGLKTKECQIKNLFANLFALLDISRNYFIVRNVGITPG
jgi:hypothetical protein